jgi:histidinol-phosphate aminotransferase
LRFARELSRISKLERYVRPEKVQGAIKLDSNENFALDGDFMTSAAKAAARHVDLREYPIDELDRLCSLLARYAGVNERYVGVGSGSDQIIELLLTTLVQKGGRATVFMPTFSYFINRCELHGILVDRVPLDADFELDAAMFSKRAKRADLVYLCSPNNPTGGQIPRKTAEAIINELDDTLVLVDEAYADFADYSLARLATRRDNVIVLRTLSKAFGLAGARIGYMVTNERMAQVFNSTIQSPYPVSTLSLAIASSVLERSVHVAKTIESVRRERERVAKKLSEISGVRVFRSDANFLFIETGRRYRAITDSLAQKGIAVKLFGNVGGHHGCMRVTIGTRRMNSAFLDCVREAVA